MHNKSNLLLIYKKVMKFAFKLREIGWADLFKKAKLRAENERKKWLYQCHRSHKCW